MVVETGRERFGAVLGASGSDDCPLQKLDGLACKALPKTKLKKQLQAKARPPFFFR